MSGRRGAVLVILIEGDSSFLSDGSGSKHWMRHAGYGESGRDIINRKTRGCIL